MADEPIKETPTEARQAVKVPSMKYVLGLSVAGAVVALVIVYFAILA